MEKETALQPVTISLAVKLPLVRLDFVLMVQVLASLLCSASMHIPPVTRVQLSGRVDGKELVLSVADSRPGIGGRNLF